MTKEDFLRELSTNLNITLTEKQISELDFYAKFLLEYNEHTNLTAIKTLEDVYLKHFYDSLTIVKNVDLTQVTTLLDIGTGAGFPGMVLKIVFPNLKVTLLDSNNKKIAFLKELAAKLALNVEIIYDRAEIFVQNRREYYDIVTSRAVADLSILAELAIPYLKVGGNFIAMKANYQEELHNALNIIKKLNSKVTKITEFTLGNTDMNTSSEIFFLFFNILHYLYLYYLLIENYRSISLHQTSQDQLYRPKY